MNVPECPWPLPARMAGRCFEHPRTSTTHNDTRTRVCIFFPDPQFYLGAEGLPESSANDRPACQMGCVPHSNRKALVSLVSLDIVTKRSNSGSI